MHVGDLQYVIECQSSGLSDEDVVQVCLLILLELGFLGQETTLVVNDELLRLVDDLDAWNNYPSGS